MRSSNHSIDKYKGKVIAVIGGGISNERDISLMSAKNVEESLERLGLNWISLDPMDPKFFTTPFDIAFNCLHGQWGEDGGLQGYCELRQIPYTGPGIKATSVGLNKPIFKAVLNQLGIPVPALITSPTTYPFIVKPVSEGSSIGISIVSSRNDWETLLKKKPEVIEKNYFMEEYIVGQEVTAGVIEIDGEIVVMPILEIETANTFYDYDGKYTPGKSTYILPANIDKDTDQMIQDISREIYAYFSCKGCIRIDFMIDDTGPKVLEMNTSPGITKGSNVPAQSKAMGLSFDELVLHYLNSARD